MKHARRLLPDDVIRSDNHTVEMVGKRFGNLTVLALAGRKDWGIQPSTGWRHRALMLRCRCDCGAEWETPAAPVRLGRTQRCRVCALRVSGEKGRGRSTPLPDGRTVAQIAAEADLPLGTVYRRWLRGWPAEKLALPIQGWGSRIPIGGSRDRSERRGTVYPQPSRTAA